MRRLLCLFCFLVLLCVCQGRAAQAQRVEFYGTFAVTHAGNVPDGVVQTTSGFQAQYTELTTAQLGGGATYNVFRMPLVSVGLDARGATHTGIGSLDDSLFGVKVAANVPVLRVKPYIEAGAGLMTTRARNISSASSGETTTAGSFTSHYDYYEVLGGLDYPWKKVLDFRLVEIGAGSSFGNAPNASVFSFNTGVVLHF